MKVRATQLGYYNHKRWREGTEFEIVAEKDFSKKWMVKVDGEQPLPKPTPVKEVPKKEPSREVI